MNKFFLLCSLFFLIIGCSNSNNKNTIKFSKDQFGKNWPFSINEIEIYCDGYDELYFYANGKTYPLNGSAKGTSKKKSKISDVDEIWLDDPNFIGTKIPYPQEFFQKGLTLCENFKQTLKK